jgi:hypothetical protein
MSVITDSRGRVRRILSVEEMEELTPSQIGLLRGQGVLMPVAGGSPPDDDDDNKDDDDKDPDDKDDDKDPADKDDDDKDDDDDDKDEYVRLPKAEAERLRKENLDAKKAERKRKREERDKAEKDKADKGKFEEIANDAKKERDEAIQAKEEAENKLKTYERKSRVEAIAKRLMFIDPDDAHRYLEPDEMDDEDRAERALKRVLREKKHLKSSKPPSGGPLNGGGGDGLFTLEQIRAMSEEEHIANKDKVDKSLAALGQGG